jgi:maleylacetate reductase
VLGGLFDLPHAEMHTIILPHALAYNAPAVPNAMAAVARALQVSDGAAGLWNLSRDLGAKTALKDIGFPVARFDEAVTSALERPYWNPREITEAGIRDLLHRAVFGIAPTPADVESEKR